MAKRITKNEEMAIVEAIEKGSSISKVSREFNRGKASISRILKKNNIKMERSKTKKATEARKSYAKESRLDILSDLFEVIKRKLQGVENTAKDVFDLSKSLGIAIDKARLEEGEPTEITKGEMKNTNNNYHEIDLDQLPLEVVREIAKADNRRITEKKPDTA